MKQRSEMVEFSMASSVKTCRKQVENEEHSSGIVSCMRYTSTRKVQPTHREKALQGQSNLSDQFISFPCRHPKW